MAYDEHTSVLDLLEAINDTAEPFAFQRECRMFRCGSCGVKVNGKPVLACHKRVTELARSREMVIEPLTCFPLIKDLLVDFSADLLQRAKLRPFPEAASAGFETPSLKELDAAVLATVYGVRSLRHLRRSLCRSEASGKRAPNPMHLRDRTPGARSTRSRQPRHRGVERGPQSV